MSSYQLPIDVVEFAESHLTSVHDLEVLMVLVDSPSRWWDAAMIAQELGLTTRVARNSLEHLATRNLLDIRITGDVKYQLRPSTPELDRAVTLFAATYRRHSPSVTRMVLERAAGRRAREFADAFRIRRDDSG